MPQKLKMTTSSSEKAWKMYRDDGKTLEEIGAALGMSAATIYKGLKLNNEYRALATQWRTRHNWKEKMIRTQIERKPKSMPQQKLA